MKMISSTQMTIDAFGGSALIWLIIIFVQANVLSSADFHIQMIHSLTYGK